MNTLDFFFFIGNYQNSTFFKHYYTLILSMFVLLVLHFVIDLADFKKLRSVNCWSSRYYQWVSLDKYRIFKIYRLFEIIASFMT